MPRRSSAIIAVLGVATVALYWWPVPNQHFSELADRVPEGQRQSLLAFRAQYPPQTLRVGDQDWAYAVIGAGEETVLFLHGMTGAYDIWWQQMLPLSEQYRVISLTYPPVETLAGMSEGVLAILDKEGVQRTHVVGSSLGGYLAQYLMHTHPERLRKVVLGNTFPPNDILREKNATLIRILPFLPNWVVMAFFRSNFEKSVYPAAGNSELVLAYMLEQVAGRMSKAQVIARAKAVIEPFPPPDPDTLGIPVMIIEADNDPLVETALRRQLKTTYANAEVHTLHEVGHFPYLNAPNIYTDLLRSFFREDR